MYYFLSNSGAAEVLVIAGRATFSHIPSDQHDNAIFRRKDRIHSIDSRELKRLIPSPSFAKIPFCSSCRQIQLLAWMTVSRGDSGIHFTSLASPCSSVVTYRGQHCPPSSVMSMVSQPNVNSQVEQRKPTDFCVFQRHFFLRLDDSDSRNIQLYTVASYK